MNSNELVVRINPAEIVTLQKDAKTIVMDPKAEDAIKRLLDLQREVDGAVDFVKAEIERQALDFNPNFTSVKGDKVKVNYSAAGAKYKGSAKSHNKKFWTKKISWSINAKAVDEFRLKNYRLPTGIEAVTRTKTIRISEVGNV